MDNRLLAQLEILKLSGGKMKSIAEKADESLGMQLSVTVVAVENGCVLHIKNTL